MERVIVYGLLNLSFWGYVLAAIVLTQLTIASITIYLHRHQAHRALTLHPVVSHFFRFWLWLTTGMITSDWVAIHRKHHASTDVEGDPHSPAVEGIKKVFWQGAELYRKARKDKPMLEKYAHGTPNDWIENHLYKVHSSKGLWLMLVINLVLFGVPGIIIFGLQGLWTPLWAAGVVNGIGHYWGYRNYECHDTSTNVSPWGFWIGGEELHNNHHTFPSSAKFSVKSWEFDIGWMYISILSFFGLAKVKKLPPQLGLKKDKAHVDIETVKAVVSNRFQVMALYYKQVLAPMLRQVKQHHVENKDDKELVKHAHALLKKEADLLSPKSSTKLQALLERYEQLRVAYQHRQSLQHVWKRTAASQKELIDSLQLWCKQAEDSGLELLKQFADQIKGYVPKAPALG